ncbi:hypothetical protein J4526_01510 [Desulfurococcaceae archaeon MEX13E-LK6-19]|nr:hypothetical protein J4526_01510 [Desulfurococcaceae archaeon MEX13E-LK6-19]
MPCHDYHPKRFTVEVDERDYEGFMTLCQELLSSKPIAATKTRLHGLCLEAIMSIANKALEIINESGLTIDDFFKQKTTLKVIE